MLLDFDEFVDEDDDAIGCTDDGSGDIAVASLVVADDLVDTNI